MTYAARPAVQQLISLALDEDLGRGDATTEALALADASLAAAVTAREELVIFGLEIARDVFTRLDERVEVDLVVADGALLAPGGRALCVRGPAASILAAERTALNFLQRLSGVATVSRRFADAVAGTSARVVDTRKTTPGYRGLEKLAVRAGGCHNHRADLAGGILIKDNHIAAYGSVAAAVSRAGLGAPHSLRIEIEVDSEAQLDEALAAGVDAVLLDNMTPDEVARLAPRAQDRGVVVEVSGGLTLDTVRAYAEAGADILSVGALTHSAPAVDLGLDAE